MNQNDLIVDWKYVFPHFFVRLNTKFLVVGPIFLCWCLINVIFQKRAWRTFKLALNFSVAGAGMTQQSPRFAKLRHFWHQPQEAKQLVLIEEQLAVGTTPRDHPQASKEGTEQSNHFERSPPRVRNKRPTISTNASPPIRATAGSVFEKAARRRHSTHQELENARRTLPQMESGEMLRVSCENLSLRSSQSVEGTPQREEKRPVANRIPGGERASKNDFPSSSRQEMEQLGNVGEERAGRFAVDKSWTRTFSEEESVGSAAELVPAGAANLEHEEEGEDGSDRDAVERLATRWRGFLARKEFLKKREATLTIQTLWRGHRQRQEFKVCRLSFLAPRILSHRIEIFLFTRESYQDEGST